jgi:hypothetical protein
LEGRESAKGARPFFFGKGHPRKLARRKATQRWLTGRHVGACTRACRDDFSGEEVGMTRLLYDIDDYLEDAPQTGRGRILRSIGRTVGETGDLIARGRAGF